MPDIEFADNDADVLTLKVPYSDFSRHDPSGQLKQLTDPPEPEIPAMNPIKRFVVTTVGIFFLMVGLIGLSGGQNTLISIVCIFFGLLVIWTFIARPEMKKRKAASLKTKVKNPDVSISFTKQNIVMRSLYSELKKDWPELEEHRKTKKGVHLTFTGGTEVYLPLDAFYGDEVKTLTTLLQNRKTGSKFNVQSST